MDNTQLALTWMRFTAVVGATVAMLYGLNRVYERLKTLNQGFGPNSLRAIGIVMFLPVLLILALVTDFKTETLAALLGTVAGYVLSLSKPDQ